MGRASLAASHLLTLDALDVSFTSLTLAVIAVYIAYCYLAPASSKRLRPTYSIHPLAPGLVSGAYAAYQLGSNETAFLLQLHRDYGPIVFVPFPLGQHLILSDTHIRRLYAGAYNKQLSFIPVRKALSGTIFGTSDAVLSSPALEGHIFPLHTKALAKGNLKVPVSRFQKAVEVAIEEQKDADSVDLVKWTYDLMFKASMSALFGDGLDLPMDVFQDKFKAFDDAFPLLATGMFPRLVQDYLSGLTPVREGILARNYLNEKFGEWAARTDCAPLDEKDVVKAMSDKIREFGWSLMDLGSCVLGDFWALLANNPFAISWITIYLTQINASLFKEVLQEVDSVDVASELPADAHLPLLTSIIYETLRLHTSSFSARKATSPNEAFIFEDVAEIHPGEICVALTRIGHLDSQVWGEDAAVWDGKRFFDEDGTNVKSKRIHEVRAFGGGVSMCEGRSLAIAELKTMLVFMLQNLTFEAQLPAPDQLQAHNMERLPYIDGTKVTLPKPKPGRPGLGVMQVGGQMPVRIRHRVRA